MEFYRYLNILKKRLPIIILLTILGGVSAYGFTQRQPKVYRATATLLINAASPSLLVPYLNQSLGSNGAAPVQQLANTYDVFLKSGRFDATVISRLHLAVTPEQLSAHISSDLIPGTNYYHINVTWGDPRQGATIATGIARVFVDENKRVQAEQLAQQQAQQSSSPAGDIGQSLDGFRRRISELQKQLNVLLTTPHVRQTQITQTEDRLNGLTDTYVRLLGLAGTTVQPISTNTAVLNDNANPQYTPIFPKVSQNVLSGLAAGLLLGLALAFLLDYLDNSLHSPEDVELLLGQAPLGIVGLIGIDAQTKGRGVLGRGRKIPTPAAMTVPASNGNGKGGGGAATLAPLTVLNPQLVTLNHPKAAITEAFRTLRTNLDFSTLDRSLKSLVVTSSVPSEGKSTISANLAVAEAQAGKRVILVDADLRRPTISKIFGLKREVGLTTVLLNRENRARAIDEALQPTVVPNLYVMASGPHPPNPAELLASQSAVEVVHELMERSDLVIFDTPPMGPLTDAVVLSARVDGTLLVARAGSTRRNVVDNSVNTIKKVGGNVVGTVLNMVNRKDISNYSYYYYYSNEYYGAEETKAASGARG